MSAADRLLLFLYSRRNIAGSLLALGGVALYLTGIIDRFWLPIVAGLYGVGYLATPRPAKLLVPGWSTQSPKEIADSLAALVKHIRGRVEPDVLDRVTSIVTSINETLPRLTAADAELDDAHFTVRQMAIDYLPSTLDSYLKLPAVYRGRRTLSSGKTAHAMLEEQLALLDSKMQEVVVSVVENDTQALLANGLFLRERFADHELKLS